MRVRALAALTVITALATLTGCGGGGAVSGSDGGEGVFGSVAPSAPASTTAGPATTAPQTTAAQPTAEPALRCEQLGDAAVGAVAFPLADYGGTSLVQLQEGRYTDTDGTLIELLPACATGDLNGDGAIDAVAAVRIDPEGSGTFYTLVAWLATEAGTPALAGSEPLGDRNPVQAISIARGVVTVVYFTRTAEVPLAGLNVRRTATYEFAEPGLDEISHSDVSCGPCNP